MITLRLFEASNPFQEIAVHALGKGETVIGRDPSADFTIEDGFGDLSRRHCVIRNQGGRIVLVDTSSNGVRIGPDKAAAPAGQDVELKPGQTIWLGQYAILVDGEADAPAKKPAAARAAVPTDAALLEQFCIGAGLEPSSFAGEDPAQLMQRLGAVYRQVVDDLCDMMRDRAMTKDYLQMDRTTISARDNNPLKWAPPHRIAVELLQEGETSFLKGSEAFRASFADLRRHGFGLVEGSRAAIDFVLAELAPERLEDAKAQPLAFLSRNDAAWKRYRQVHAELVLDAADDGGRINGALRAGYEAGIDPHAERDDAA